MPLETLRWLDRLKAVEREYRIVRLGTDRLAVEAALDPTILGRALRVREIGPASQRLEGTYVVRLFAEFETALRLFWTSTRTTPVPDRIADIVDSIAARQGIADGYRMDTHRVRGYRNRLVHQREEDGEVVAMVSSRRYLCTFLGKMPLNW
jgi:hypothetical protein